MQYRGMSRSHLFLIELIVVILFFSIAVAITVQVFSKAYELTQNSRELNGAILAVQTAAEMDKTSAFSEIDINKGPVYYNSNWELTTPSEAAYTLKTNISIERRETGSMAVYNYTVMSGEKTIYKIQTKKYYPGEFAAEDSPIEVDR
ncbi:MAG TPA: type II secretion system protein [Clostridiales bacterium]|jgi:type II secretory pathway pseudopilin PulG|nr:type II secretion system protein [Clostridiales bacterium]